jgi:subtilase family serine protease
LILLLPRESRAYIRFGLLVAVLLLATPLSTAMASSGVNAIAPQELRDYYGVTPLIQSGYTGKGVTVAIIAEGADKSFLSDFEEFDSHFMLPPASVTVQSPFGSNVTDSGPTSDSADWVAGAELVHAMAPDARIVIVYVGNHTGQDGFSFVIDHNSADIATSSLLTAFWGNGSKYKAEAYNSKLAMSIAENITLIASSGDSGSNDTILPPTAPFLWTSHLPNAYEMPEFSPYVTAVGGTELTVDAGGISGETGWNDTSGMASNLFTQPAWQAGPGVPGNDYRDIPDVALDASCQSPPLYYWNSSLYWACGTSYAAPVFAGIVADIEQAAGHRLGFLNPGLYKLASSDPSAFHDITSGCSFVKRVFAATKGYCAGPGWDYVTGLGSPNAVALLRYFAPDSVLSGSTLTTSPITSTLATCGQTEANCSKEAPGPIPWWPVASIIAVVLGIMCAGFVVSRSRKAHHSGQAEKRSEPLRAVRFG